MRKKFMLYKIIGLWTFFVLLSMMGCCPCEDAQNCKTTSSAPEKQTAVTEPSTNPTNPQKEKESSSATPIATPTEAKSVKSEEESASSKEAQTTKGVRTENNSDGSIKVLEFLEAPAVWKVEDRARLSKVRVIRGKGPLTKDFVDSWKFMPRLTEVLWTEVSMEDNCFKILSEMKELKKLRLGDLKSTKLGDILVSIGQCPSLTDLDLSRSGVTDKDLTALKGLSKLTRLNLYSTAITDAGVKELEPLSGHLTWLNLDATAITDTTGTYLVKFGKLEFLHLGRTIVTDAIIDSLVQLTSLKTIHVTRTKITENGAKKLQEKLPKLEVITKVKE